MFRCSSAFFSFLVSSGPAKSAPRSLRLLRSMSTGNETSKKTDESELIINRLDCTRLVTLNRPKALNALNLTMIRSLYPLLQQWEADPDIRMVVLKGAGEKAFCAGGDVLVIKSAKEGGTVHEDFFRDEYKLNYLIGSYELPFVSLIDGITMGGGCGLSVHGRFRVGTDRTVLAMPETGLGLFPDVGGSYFLPRLANNLGMFLALTGYRLKGADVYHAGIATHYVTSDKMDDLEKALHQMHVDDLTEPKINHLLHEFQKDCVDSMPEFSLYEHMEQINRLFHGDSVEKIIDNLKNEGSDWSLKQVDTLNKMSPTSLKVTHRQLTEGARLSFRDVFTMEYRLSQRFCQDNDFFEGCRSNAEFGPSSIENLTRWQF